MAITITSDEVRKHVEQLQAVGDRMEAAGDPRWFSIARAAALLEGLRLGITQIDGGFDLAVPGSERSVRHA